MDNIDMAEYNVPPLTTVGVNFKLLGEKSVEQLINIIEEDYATVKAFLKHSIIERESVTSNIDCGYKLSVIFFYT